MLAVGEEEAVMRHAWNDRNLWQVTEWGIHEYAINAMK